MHAAKTGAEAGVLTPSCLRRLLRNAASSQWMPQNLVSCIYHPGLEQGLEGFSFTIHGSAIPGAVKHCSLLQGVISGKPVSREMIFSVRCQKWRIIFDPVSSCNLVEHPQWVLQFQNSVWEYGVGKDTAGNGERRRGWPWLIPVQPTYKLNPCSREHCHEPQQPGDVQVPTFQAILWLANPFGWFLVLSGGGTLKGKQVSSRDIDVTKPLSKVNHLSFFPYQFGPINNLKGLSVLAWKLIRRTFGTHLAKRNCMLLKFTQWNQSGFGCWGNSLRIIPAPCCVGQPHRLYLISQASLPSQQDYLMAIKQKELEFSSFSKVASNIWWIRFLCRPSFSSGISFKS